MALPPEKRALLEQRLQESAERSRAVPHIPRRENPEQPSALSFAQQRSWFMNQVRPAFHQPGVVRIEGGLDTGALRLALNGLVARHEALRTTFELRGGVPVQLVRPPAEVPLPVRDLTGLPEEERDPAVRRAVLDESRRPIDLTRDLLLRAELLKFDEHTHVILLTIHHIAMDAWSMGVMIREIAALYEAFGEGRPSPLAPLPCQYADFAAWQRDWLRGERLEQQLDYWRGHLGAEPPRLELPVDRPRSSEQAFAGAAHDLSLSAGLTERLKALADQEGATLFMVLLAAAEALLHRYTGQQDLVVGSTIANRNQPGTEGLIACFVNTVALRTDVSGDPGFRELLNRVRETTLGAYQHQDLPFEKLVQELHPQRDLNQSPIVRMMFNYDNTPQTALEFAGLRLEPVPLRLDVVHFDLTLTITGTPAGELLTTWEYNTELFEAGTVALLATRLRSVLEQAVADPDRPVSELDLLAEEDLDRLAVWNATEAPVPDATVHSLFELQAARTPDNEAVVLGDVSLTYAELNARANQLAHFLREAGVGPETPVGICVDRSPELAVAVLGVLKAGGAYVPLDPAYPSERLAFMLADSAVRLLLTREHLLASLPEYSGPVVALDAEWPRIAQHPATDPAPVATGQNLAYVIYTSGSTGRPKGALTEHRALVNYTLGAIEAFEMVPSDRILQFASLGFDVLVEELFPAWLSGAAVVMVPERFLGSSADLLALVREQRLTAFELPTAYWHEWVFELARSGAELPACLRLVIVGGERVLPERLESWQRLGVPLVHVYGLTETTVTTTTYRLPAAASPSVWHNLPIGKPLRNMRTHVLDERMRPVPVGIAGELYIGGASVARGYLNRPELTEQRFRPDPFGQGPEGSTARLYRTGDLVRQLSDGNLEFLGRLDTQVKVRGYRIEPAEVEAALGRHPSLRELVVVVREDAPGDKRLTAYAVPVEGARPDAGELRRFLGQSLPAHLIPSAFVLLEALPLNPHGKVDRAALPAPDGSRPAVSEEFVAPALPAEEVLAQIWAEVIGLDRVGVHDNFFEIGGDSILSIQIVARAHAAGLRLTPMDIFRHPTVEELARAAGREPEARAEQGPVTGPLPATALQRWFFEQRFASPEHWNMAVLLEVRADYGPTLLRTALAELLRHHDGLRQRFEAAADGVHARIDGVDAELPFDVHDLGALPADARVRELESLAIRVQTGLDLARGPLVRAALFLLGPDEPPRLLVVAHHLVVDAVSWRIMLEDFRTICEALRLGAPVGLPAKTTSFRSWAEQMEEYARSAELAAEAGYWASVTSAATGVLPVDFPDARERNTVGEADRVTVLLGAEQTAALLHEVPAVYHTQINDALLTALGRTLSRWTGRDAHLVEVEGHGRQELSEGTDLSRTVGWFTAVHPVLLEVGADDGAAEAIKRVKEQLRGVPRGGIGHALLRNPAGRGSAAAGSSEISFSYFGQLDRLVGEEGPFVPATEPVGPLESPAGRRPHLVEVSCEISGGRLRISWRYGRRVHRRGQIEELAQSYLRDLGELIEHCRTTEQGGFTPSDFPRARLSQAALDSFMSRIATGATESGR